jgi:serine/threonine protein phosphatase PrpC
MGEAAVTSKVAGAAQGCADAPEMAVRPVSLSVRCCGLTNAGQVRANNEDQFLVAALRKAIQVQWTSLPARPAQYSDDQCHLFVVADGVGGYVGGERASALAIDSVQAFLLNTLKWFTRCKGKGEDRLLADFQEALRQANARVLAEGNALPELHDMATTLTLAYSLNDMLFVAHVGDSRCYLLRHGYLCMLTRDHTVVDELVRRGHLRAEDAAEHKWRHMLTNVVGGESSEVAVEVHKVQLEAGDAVLLCTDGLTNMVPDEAIAETLLAQPDPEKACVRLVALANEAGGKDNITVVIARFAAVA